MFFWRSRCSNWLQTILENWNKLLETFHWHQHLQWTWASKSLNLLNLFQLILEDVFPRAETPPIWKLVTSLRCWTATFHHSNIPLGDSLGSLFRRALPWHGFLPCSWFLCLDMQVDLGWRLVRALKELTCFGVGLYCWERFSRTCNYQKIVTLYTAIWFEISLMIWIDKILYWYELFLMYVHHWHFLLTYHRVASNGSSICCGFDASLLAEFLHSLYIFSHVGLSRI